MPHRDQTSDGYLGTTWRIFNEPLFFSVLMSQLFQSFAIWWKYILRIFSNNGSRPVSSPLNFWTRFCESPQPPSWRKMPSKSIHVIFPPLCGNFSLLPLPTKIKRRVRTPLGFLDSWWNLGWFYVFRIICIYDHIDLHGTNFVHPCRNLRCSQCTKDSRS